MTTQEVEELQKRFNQLVSITDSLWRKNIKNKAWITALQESLIPLIAKETGKSQKEIKLALVASMKAAYQKEMEYLEKLDPSLAARLDTRSIEEL